jgi:hypothetical protein
MDQKERRPFRQALEGFSEKASGAFARAKRRPFKVALLLVAAAAVGMAIVFAVRGLPSWAQKAGLSELKQRTKEDPTSYEHFRSLGHAQFAAGRRAAALRAYARALSLSESAVDDTMVNNLAFCFGLREQKAAEKLIVRHHIVAMVPRLEQLTGSRSRDVRWAAIATLERMGRASKQDYAHAYLADLEAPACEVRQRAVEKLGEIGDRRVEAQLGAAKKRDDEATPWYRSSCLGNRVEDAQKKIEARSSEHKTLARK